MIVVTNLWDFIPQMTALHCATMREVSSLSVVECLVENGADVNGTDEENVSSVGNTPPVAYIASATCIASGYMYLLLLLQMTPLHNAARFANMGVVKYLVDHKSDLNINDRFGVSYLQ